MTATTGMTPAAVRRLMAREWTPPAEASEAEALDGNPVHPAIARVLLDCRETIAEATCEAILALVDLGVDYEDARTLIVGSHRFRG